MLIRTVYPGSDPDTQNSSILTGELIRQFEHLRIAAVKTEPERRRTSASIRSYVVQARSIVAPGKMRFYHDLILPDLSDFRKEKVEMPKRTRPRALDIGVIAAINAAAPQIAEERSRRLCGVLDVLASWSPQRRDKKRALELD